MAVPRLSLDRPFTYLLPKGSEAGTGSLVSVPFHGRTVRGWVLGPAADVPGGRLLEVRSIASPVRFFDQRMLQLLRWVSERYVAPLATVIERSHPPRVAGEENRGSRTPPPEDPSGRPSPRTQPGRASRSPGAGPDPDLLEPGSATWLRPLPGREAEECVRLVGRCLQEGRTAVVLVPEVEPLPETGRAVLEAFGSRAVSFLGGDPRERYRNWLDILAGRYDAVVGSRPGVFAPLSRLGLLWVAREVHPGHREERAPYYHVREVALARARLHGAACVLAALSPSVDTIASVERGEIRVLRPSRVAEREVAPLVEPTAPEAEDRSPRLTALLKQARSAALILSRRGYGVARVCRVCGAPAGCDRCGGPIVVEGGRTLCRVCSADGRCAACGAADFGVERGGTERIAQWAARITAVPVDLETGGRLPPPPSPDRVLVGTAAAVKDVRSVRLDLVAILDPDRALTRAGIHAGERSLATWMEAAAWAGSKRDGGRVLLHTRQPAHPAIQALVRWDPAPFLWAEAGRRAETGFPPGHPVFRIEGRGGLDRELRAAGATSVLSTSAGDRTVCLVAVTPRALPEFRERILELAVTGTVVRVEAEPQL